MTPSVDVAVPTLVALGLVAFALGVLVAAAVLCLCSSAAHGDRQMADEDDDQSMGTVGRWT